MCSIFRIEDMRRSTQELFMKDPEAVIAMAKDGSGPVIIENKNNNKQSLILMSWEDYLEMQDAVYES